MRPQFLFTIATMLLLRLLAAFAAFRHVSAQTQTNAVQLFIHNMDPEAQWAASIQNACSGSTTYVISCTSAPMNNACSPQVSPGIHFAIAQQLTSLLDCDYHRGLRRLHRHHASNILRDQRNFHRNVFPGYCRFIRFLHGYNCGRPIRQRHF